MEEAQRLLKEQQRRAESLRTRGGQIAGFGAAVLALIGGNAGTILGATEGTARALTASILLGAAVCLTASVVIAIWGLIKPQPFVAVAADEIAIFASDRFLGEPDLGRVHLRSLHSLEEATREAQENGNAAAKAILSSLYFFSGGLGFSLISLGTLTLGLI